MKIRILAVGERLPDWAEAACDDYLKRLPREWHAEVVSVKPDKRTGVPTDTLKANEATRLLERCPKGTRRIALDEHGRQISTRELAVLLADWRGEGRDVALLMGGADGLDAGLLEGAEMKLALSRLTLPHALARVVLLEQLYRAASLLAGHPYHRD